MTKTQQNQQSNGKRKWTKEDEKWADSVGLDSYEREIEKHLIENDPEPLPDDHEVVQGIRQVADNTYKKMISIRLFQGDLYQLKEKAKKKGIPYQTIINMLVKQYVEGKIDLRV